jgi:hypothetical protein
MIWWVQLLLGTRCDCGFQVKVTLRPTVSLPVGLGVRHPSGSRDQFSPSFFCIDNCGFLDVGRPLWWEGGSVIYLYNCFWALPEQSISGPCFLYKKQIYIAVCNRYMGLPRTSVLSIPILPLDVSELQLIRWHSTRRRCWCRRNSRQWLSLSAGNVMTDIHRAIITTNTMPSTPFCRWTEFEIDCDVSLEWPRVFLRIMAREPERRRLLGS